MLVWPAGFNDLYLVFPEWEEVLWVSFHSTRVEDGMRLQGVRSRKDIVWYWGKAKGWKPLDILVLAFGYSHLLSLFRATQCITVALREPCLRGAVSQSHLLGHPQSNWCEGERNRATSKRRQGALRTPGRARSGSYVEHSVLPGSCSPRKNCARAQVMP